MSESQKIDVTVGQQVAITLQSMVGSTGYGWYLTSLGDGLALSCASTCHDANEMMGPVDHVFEFLAVKEGVVTLEFKLIAPWKVGDSADITTYEVTIAESKRSAAEELDSALGGRKFSPTSSVSYDSSVVLKYAPPIMMKYAPPVMVKYAPPVMMKYAPPVMMKYAPPVMMKYAPPVMMKYAPPVMMKYDVPSSRGGACMSSDDCCQPALHTMYGVPSACTVLPYGVMPSNCDSGCC